MPIALKVCKVPKADKKHHFSVNILCFLHSAEIVKNRYMNE